LLDSLEQKSDHAVKALAEIEAIAGRKPFRRRNADDLLLHFPLQLSDLAQAQVTGLKAEQLAFHCVASLEKSSNDLSGSPKWAHQVARERDGLTNFESHLR
jgi:hypothetical protein